MDASNAGRTDFFISLRDGKPFDAKVILQHLGKCGPYQMMYFVCTAYAMLFPTAVILSVIFTAAVPAHRCFVSGCDNETDSSYVASWMSNLTVESLTQGTSKETEDWSCRFQDISLSPECQPNNYVQQDTCYRWVYDQSMTVSSVVTQFDLVCQDSWKAGFVLIATMIGFSMGSIFLSSIPNWIGRRKAFLFFSVWLSSVSIGSSFAPNYSTFTGLRFLIGMGAHAVMQTTILWGLESIHPASRIKYTFGLSICQAFGNLIMTLIAFLTRKWYPLQLYFFCPIALLITYFFFLPESTVWLIAKKRFSEAKAVYEKAARLNRVTIPPHLLIFSPTNEPATESLGRRVIQVFDSSCAKFKSLGILFLAWLSISFCYYGLSFASINLSGDIYFNFALVIAVEIPAYLIGLLLEGNVNKRWIFAGSLFGSGASCLTAGLVPEDQQTLIIIFSLLGKFFISLQLVTVNLITSKMTGSTNTPSEVLRIGICSAMGKTGGIFSPFISLLAKVDRSLPYKIVGGINLCIGLLSLMCLRPFKSKD